MEWHLGFNPRNPGRTGDKALFELYSVHPPIYLEVDTLSISDNSNWAFPFSLRVRGGRIGMTYAEVNSIIEDWQHLTFIEERDQGSNDTLS